jgi:hypothetical protein
VLKIKDPSSRQSGRPIIKKQCPRRIYMEEKEKLVAGPRWWPDTTTDINILRL